ncbi:hypothetical protein OAN95_03530 [Alphaproteobacteria bacterium]|nr:hypothetical protein [Alphaproteobacteria bacterium]
MEIFGLMSLGLFLGMTHAMDADHIATVSAMWNRQGGKHGLMQRGLCWVAGHGIALLALCAVLLSTGQALSELKQALLELGASLLILYLGGQLVWRMYRRRVHIHIHEHDGKRHLHMHSHLNDHPKPNATIPHDELAHDHKHANKSPFLALVVGLAHGAAGFGQFDGSCRHGNPFHYAFIHLCDFILCWRIGGYGVTYRCRCDAIVACRHARRCFWQSGFGDNSLSLPVDWWHYCSSMPCKAGRLLNIFLSLNHHHPEHLDNVTIRKHPRETRIQTAMADTIHVAKPSRS